MTSFIFMKNPNCTFSSYVDFVNYMAHIPKKKDSIKKSILCQTSSQDISESCNLAEKTL